MLVAGDFGSSTMEVGSTTLSNADGDCGFYGCSDVWLGQLDPAGSGSWDWALRVGGDGVDYVKLMVLLESGKVRGAAFAFILIQFFTFATVQFLDFLKSQDSEFKSQTP